MYSRELQVAVRAAKMAAKEIRNRYGRNAEVHYKTPIEPVTDADLVADRIIRKRLCRAFPADGWLSEESADDGQRLTRDRVWVVDPLDGTREYLAGRPEFCVSVGLVQNGRPVLGVIVNPVTGDVYAALEGGGATRNGEPIAVATNNSVENFLVAVSRSETKRGLLTPFDDAFELQPAGGMCHKLVMVATGEVDATFTCHTRCEWDMAAGVVILSEAGGVTTTLDGSPLQFNRPSPVFEGIVATHSQGHRGFLAAIHRARTA